MRDVWLELDNWLYSKDPDLTVYVYRIDANKKVIKPYLVKCEAWPDLCMTLRDQYDGGLFQVLIRKGRKMVFSGEISIATPSMTGRLELS